MRGSQGSLAMDHRPTSTVRPTHPDGGKGLGSGFAFRREDATGIELPEVWTCEYWVAQLYLRERPHQGLDNELIQPDERAGRAHGDLRCNERLGGMLKYYYRVAA